MKLVKILLPLFAAAVFFSACTTLKKDLSLDDSKDQRETDIAKLEQAIVPLEAIGGAEARKKQAEMTQARKLIADMGKEAEADADFKSRLLAYDGRLAILEGKYSDAQRLYRQSIALSPGNVPSIILGIRLEGDPAKRLEQIERELSLAGVSSASSGYGELQIEKARALAEMRRFSESAGSFDAAFAASINPVYRASYQDMRDRAWDLRNATGSASMFEILEKGGIGWKDCITLVKTETQLLRFITGGRDMNETDLFNRLIERSFIPATQDININDWPTAKPNTDEIVTRAGAAWLVWHLYAEARADRGLLTRYSARYATGSRPRSPIADIPPLSPFFDSILGCVETELLSLPDGRNFKSADPIRASELLAVLKKIDN